jgi:hypothetical protein
MLRLEFFANDVELQATFVPNTPASGLIPPIERCRHITVPFAPIRLVLMTSRRQRRFELLEVPDRDLTEEEIATVFHSH